MQKDMVIEYAGTLTANDVVGRVGRVGRKIKCPACNVFIFQKWPLGWDAHVANKCPIAQGDDAKSRKLWFKNRYRH